MFRSDPCAQSPIVRLGLLQSGVTLPGKGEGAVHVVRVLPLLHFVQGGVPHFFEHPLSVLVDQGSFSRHRKHMANGWQKDGKQAINGQ